MMKELFGGLICAVGMFLVDVGMVWVGDNIDGRKVIIDGLRKMADGLDDIIRTSKTIKKGE